MLQIKKVGGGRGRVAGLILFFFNWNEVRVSRTLNTFPLKI
jgi:hypothetical protein